MFLFYSLSPTFLIHSFTYEPCGKCTQNMVLVYFIGRYIAKFGMPKIIRDKYVLILMSCIAIIFVTNYFFFDRLFLSKDNNLFIIIEAICIFQLFSQFSITEKTTGTIIRYLASYAFPIYLLNIFLVEQFEPYYIEYRNSRVFLFYYLLAQGVILTFSFASIA